MEGIDANAEVAESKPVASSRKGFDLVISTLSYHQLYIKLFLVYLVLAMVNFWPVTANITSSIRNGYGDVYQSLFNLWWFPYSLFTLHQNPYQTIFLHYPIGANLATQTLSPIAGLLVMPIYGLSPAFSYNLLYFLAFALSGLFMFMLADYLFKNKYGAFIAGLVYAFSPFHIAQATAHLDWTMIQWVPLFLLFYILTLREKKYKYALAAAICLILVAFMGDIQQGLMTALLTIVFTVIIFAFEYKQLLNKQTVLNIAYFAGFTLILSLPIMIFLFPNITGSALSVAQQNSFVSSNMEWSDNLASYFLPSYYNGLFNGISHAYTTIIYQLTYQGTQYTINIGERVSYMGYTVLALVLVGIYYDYKHSNRLRNTRIWIILMVIFGLLSLGPYLQVYTAVTSIPLPYLLIRGIPIFNIMREPGRFDMIVTICLALLSAFGFQHLIKEKNHDMALKYMAVASILIMIEYNGMPLTSSYLNNFTTSAVIPNGINEIGALNGTFSTLILPTLPNSSSTPNAYTGLSTYYVTALHKPILGGYTSRTNDSQTLAESVVPLVLAASYLEQGYGLAYPSPIVENYSNVTLLWLQNYHTAFIVVLRKAYNLTEQETLYSYLTTTYGNAIYVSNSTFIFATSNALRTYAGKSVSAYIFGQTWIPGYDFCNPYAPCNENISSMWWGNNTRAVFVYSPIDQSIKMNMTAISPVNGTPLGIFVGGNLAGQIRLSSKAQKYSVNITVPSGISGVVLYAQNNTNFPGPYFAYGVKNLTFKH